MTKGKQSLMLQEKRDFEPTEILGTPLTVVSQSPIEMARAAAELLFQQIAVNEPSSDPPVKVVFPTRLIIRKSCGCI